MNRRTIERAASVTAAMLLASVGFAANTPETEPNDNKAGAQLVAMTCGDTITGNTTGTSTTVAGAASADYFRIHCVGTGALTEYTLTMTSGAAAPLQTLSIHGLTQTAGVPNAGTDASVQTGFTVGTTKICRWYGTGAAGVDQDIDVAVTGTATSTTDYTLTLTCGPVTPTAMTGGTLPTGTVTVAPDAATSTALDTDWWVYDGSFSPVATFGHDDANATAISRTLGTGTYYIALGNYNLCNNQGSPPDDTFRTGFVLDFPNVIQQNTTTNYPTANMRATGGPTTLTGTGSRPNPFEIVWYSFAVTPPSVPIGSGLATPSTVPITGTTLLTVVVTPAANPASTVLAVQADLSSINGSSTQTFYDDGTHGDVTANDNTFSFSAVVAEPESAGPRTLPFTVSDAQARSSTGSIALTTTAAPTGRCCMGGSCSITTAYNCTQGGGSYQGDGTNCDGTYGATGTSTDSFPIAITDLSTSTTTLAVPAGSGTIGSSFAVSVGLVHTYVGDLHITISNGATSVIMADGVGLSNNLNGVYTFFDGAGTTWTAAANGTPVDMPSGLYAPGSPLAAFAGQNFEGNWTLTVYDDANIDTGNITSFSIGTVTTTVCQPSTGSCCTNRTCTITAAADCTGTWTAGGACTGPASCPPACGSSDFNCDGDVGTDSDISGFFACLSGNCPALPCISNADFNGDGDVGTDSDIEAFFRVLSGGHC